MKISTKMISNGRLVEQAVPVDEANFFSTNNGEYWIDIQDASKNELREFLLPLDLHPLQLDRCLDSRNTPGLISFGNAFLMEYPAAFDPQQKETAYFSLLLKNNILITLHHGRIPELENLFKEINDETSSSLLHLPQVLYLILDEFADLNTDAQVNVRDQIMRVSNQLAENPNKVKLSDLSNLRNQVENLVALLENQMYCITSLSSCENELLQDSHQKAYIQDMLAETEITQRGAYRLESRMRDLFNDFQAAGNDRVERRLRLLTIVSAITLPLGLIAGLLGMNVGGVPGINTPIGFWIVLIIMLLIILVQYLYFKSKGWFD